MDWSRTIEGMMNTWNPLQPLKKRLRLIRPKTLLEVFNTCDSCKEVVPMDAPYTRWNNKMYCENCGVKER